MDEIIRAVSADGFVKMQVITARGIVQRAQDIHHLTPTTSAALGRTLCAASMLGELMKEDDASLTIRVQGGGPIGSVIAVSDHEGNVRGVVGDASVDLPLRPDGKLDVGGAVGRDGMFTVSRDIGLKEPYIGSTALVSGEIAEDLAAYLVESEQIAAASGLGVLVGLTCSPVTTFAMNLLKRVNPELLEIIHPVVDFVEAVLELEVVLTRRSRKTEGIDVVHYTFVNPICHLL